jgi:hypothetical protein
MISSKIGIYSILSFYKRREVRTIFFELLRLFRISENNFEISDGEIKSNNFSKSEYDP